MYARPKSKDAILRGWHCKRHRSFALPPRRGAVLLDDCLNDRPVAAAMQTTYVVCIAATGGLRDRNARIQSIQLTRRTKECVCTCNCRGTSKQSLRVLFTVMLALLTPGTNERTTKVVTWDTLRTAHTENCQSECKSFYHACSTCGAPPKNSKKRSKVRPML